MVGDLLHLCSLATRPCLFAMIFFFKLVPINPFFFFKVIAISPKERTLFFRNGG